MQQHPGASQAVQLKAKPKELPEVDHQLRKQHPAASNAGTWDWPGPISHRRRFSHVSSLSLRRSVGHEITNSDPVDPVDPVDPYQGNITHGKHKHHLYLDIIGK